jgi:hypothetical protein
LAAQIASADVVIESDLLPEGVTVGADMGEVQVEVATPAPTPVPTVEPTTAAPTTPPGQPVVVLTSDGEQEAADTTTPQPRSSSGSATNVGGSFVLSASGAVLIAGGLLAVAVLALAPLVLRSQSKQPGKENRDGEIHINVAMEEGDHEEAQIIRPEKLNEKDRAHFTEAVL